MNKENSNMNIGVIGCGYWGTHILRNFNSSEFWSLTHACDLDENQLSKAKKQYPQLSTTTNPIDIFNNDSIDAISIATPVFSHYNLAKSALLSGKHVWVEKPLTASYEEAKELIKLAEEKNLILNVDHTFIYTPAVKKIKQLFDTGEMGDFLYFDSVRINLGLFQHDVNVLWDLAPHDLSILYYCINKKPISVSATGSCVVKYSNKEIENLAYLTIEFEDKSIAHLHVNWLSPVKIRQIIFGGTKKMLVFDDMLPNEKIKIYDTGVNIKNRDDIYEALVQYRVGDMYSPAIENKEALKDEVEHFYHSIVNNTKTKTSGEMGLYVVNILEAANKSLRNGGDKVMLKD